MPIVDPSDFGLSRTVNGMMLYQRALSLLAELEQFELPVPPGAAAASASASASASSSASSLTKSLSTFAASSGALISCGGTGLTAAEHAQLGELVRSKFTYVVSCQVYGKQRRNGERQAADVDALLHAHPNLRVAYIDETHVNAIDERGLPIVRDDFYSVRWNLCAPLD